MSRLIIHDFDDFARYTGQELGVSDYLKITQEQINLFADATLDHQWIHVDPERARTESPYKKTIAHGYLTLSLLPYLWGQVVEVQNVKMLVNYGIEKLRFNQAVTVDSEIRLRATLLSITNLRGIAKAEIKVSLEIRDCPKTAMDATVVFLYHFKWVQEHTRKNSGCSRKGLHPEFLSAREARICRRSSESQLSRDSQSLKSGDQSSISITWKFLSNLISRPFMSSISQV